MENRKPAWTRKICLKTSNDSSGCASWSLWGWGRVQGVSRILSPRSVSLPGGFTSRSSRRGRTYAEPHCSGHPCTAICRYQGYSGFLSPKPNRLKNQHNPEWANKAWRAVFGTLIANGKLTEHQTLTLASVIIFTMLYSDLFSSLELYLFLKQVLFVLATY